VSRGGSILAAVLAVAITTACAPRLAPLPSGPGTPFPDAATAYAHATEHCQSVKTLAAVLAISGRAAGNRFRAKVDAGFAPPGRVRLELPAPGKPFFVFVTDGSRATLVLPRDGRVLDNAPPGATLEALAGVDLDPDALRAIVAGCGFGTGIPSDGKAFGKGWTLVTVDQTTNWLQQIAGVWRLMAASRGPVDVRYADFAGDRPSTIRLRRSQGTEQQATDLTIRLSQVDVNQPLGDEAFHVDIPSDAKPLTLEELRRSGPLGR
jgi:outer membrane lipoprotein-sorting protein